MLSAPVLYLLKAHAVLLLFAAGYFGLLRRLTFFTLNRVYLVFALLFAAAYPALPMPALWPAAPAPVVAWVLTAASVGAPVAAAAAPPGPSWPGLLLAGYAAGAALLLGRLLGQLLSLARLHRAARPAVAPNGTPYRQLRGAGGPFSFGRTIYLRANQYPAAELVTVLAHEQAHVHQAHTLDVLLAHVATACFWLNPAAWLLRRALLDNLEYLADAATLRTGLDRRTYQYSLLRLGPVAGAPMLVSPFSFPTLKNRILMMNLPASTRWQLGRYVLAGPLVVMAALGYSAAHAETAEAAPRPAPLRKAVPEAPAPAAPSATEKTAPRGASRLPAPQAQEARRHPQKTALVAASVAPVALPPETGPKLKMQPVYYVDGQRMKLADVSALNPATIARIDVFKGKQATQLLGEEATDGVAVITTKAGEALPEVMEFNAKVQRATAAPGALRPVPTRPPADSSTAKAVSPLYLGAPGLAYITKTYPAARLIGVEELRAADGGAPRYRAQIAIGRRPGYVTFDEHGQFISSSYNK